MWKLFSFLGWVVGSQVFVYYFKMVDIHHLYYFLYDTLHKSFKKYLVYGTFPYEAFTKPTFQRNRWVHLTPFIYVPTDSPLLKLAANYPSLYICWCSHLNGKVLEDKNYFCYK